MTATTMATSGDVAVTVTFTGKQAAQVAAALATRFWEGQKYGSKEAQEWTRLTSEAAQLVQDAIFSTAAAPLPPHGGTP